MEAIRRTVGKSRPIFPQNGGVSPKDIDYNPGFEFPKTEEFDLESQSFSPVSDRRRSINKVVRRCSESTQIPPAAPISGTRRRSNEFDNLSSSNASFQQKSVLQRNKTKSRMQDPPERKPERSGLQHATSEELEEEDPFLDQDMPNEHSKTTFSYLYIVQLVSLIIIMAALVCSLVIPEYKSKTVWEMPLWKWGVMAMVLISGELISGWLIRILVFFIERNFLLRKRVLYFVYGVRNAVQKCLWLGWVLLSWNLILGHKVQNKRHGKYLPYITRVLVCFLLGTVIWLVKTLLVKVLAMSFHVNAFLDRIQDALFNQYVIETLSRPPSIYVSDEEESIRIDRDHPKEHASDKSLTFSTPLSGREASITIDRLHRLNQKNVSAWNMKRLMNVVCKGMLSTVDEHLSGSTTPNQNEHLHIRSEKQARCAAKRIFHNVAKLGSKYIYEEDLLRFMRDDEATKTMHLFEGSTESDSVSKKALKNWVVVVFRERRALALSLNDTKKAVNKLHNLLSALVSVGILIIWLLILDVSITRFLVFISSQLLLLTFVFGNTFKTTFEAVIFLFVMHPFDVGDRCEIDEVQMVVEELNILTTVFLRYDNQKIIYPNSVLATKPISNYNRSPDMGDAIDFCVHISTPVQRIASMKERITRYIEKKKEHWLPSPMIVMMDIEDMNRLKFSVWFSHTMNHQDMGERWARRALLVEEMVKIFKDLDIEYRMLSMDVNVRTLPSLVSDRLPSNWSACSK